MKTSNKILLTIFLAIIGILTGIHLTLYAKYKRGDFIAMKDLLNGDYVRHELKPAKYLVVTGMDNLTIIPSDKPYVDIHKEQASRIRFRVDGDSLLFAGDSVVMTQDGSTRAERSNTNVNIYLPSLAIIRANNTSFFLSGVTDKSKALSSEIHLDNGADMELSRNDWEDSTIRYFGRITIQSGPSSNIVLSPFAVLERLDLSMIRSVFQDENAKIDSLAIRSDSSSSIRVNGKNLSRLSHIKD